MTKKPSPDEQRRIDSARADYAIRRFAEGIEAQRRAPVKTRVTVYDPEVRASLAFVRALMAAEYLPPEDAERELRVSPFFASYRGRGSDTPSGAIFAFVGSPPPLYAFYLAHTRTLTVMDSEGSPLHIVRGIIVEGWR